MEKTWQNIKSGSFYHFKLFHNQRGEERKKGMGGGKEGVGRLHHRDQDALSQLRKGGQHLKSPRSTWAPASRLSSTVKTFFHFLQWASQACILFSCSFQQAHVQHRTSQSTKSRKVLQFSLVSLYTCVCFLGDLHLTEISLSVEFYPLVRVRSSHKALLNLPAHMAALQTLQDSKCIPLISFHVKFYYPVHWEERSSPNHQQQAVSGMQGPSYWYSACMCACPVTSVVSDSLWPQGL